jgi:hypothetical protein
LVDALVSNRPRLKIDAGNAHIGAGDSRQRLLEGDALRQRREVAEDGDRGFAETLISAKASAYEI